LEYAILATREDHAVAPTAGVETVLITVLQAVDVNPAVGLVMLDLEQQQLLLLPNQQQLLLPNQ